jgi:hypothetical protein
MDLRRFVIFMLKVLLIGISILIVLFILLAIIYFSERSFRVAGVIGDLFEKFGDFSGMIQSLQ